jgi:Vacuolar segregation subunit 7
MASKPATEPNTTKSTSATKSDARSDGDKQRATNANSPQQHATRRTENLSTESLDHSISDSIGQERRVNREASPLRPQFKTSASGTTRSRKNSQELSPTRNVVNTFSHPVPSAAAVQRALSANKPPLQAPSVDGGLDSRTSTSAASTPRWPNSPRLTSPPPSNTPRHSNAPLRRQESDMTAPNISQKRLATPAADLSISTGKVGSEKEDGASQRSGLKTPTRGISIATSTLETVAENSVPDTPSVIPPSAHSTVQSQGEKEEHQKTDAQDVAQSKGAKGSGGSESDNGAAKSAVDTLVKPSNNTGGKSTSNLSKRSLPNLAATKSRTSEPPPRSMTVETETVSSIPQGPLNVPGERGVSGKLDGTGGVRPKPSNELMKPKKEKKRNARRPASINTGTGIIYAAFLGFATLTRVQFPQRRIFSKPRWPAQSMKPTLLTQRRHSFTNQILPSLMSLVLPVIILALPVQPP